MPPHGHGHSHGAHGHSHGAPAAAPKRDHGHGHDHGHGPVDRGKDGRRALKIALLLNSLFLIVEASVGWWSRSLALLSDAAHMVSDVAALALALLATYLATTPETSRRPFGLVRAEILGAFVNAITLVVACGLIFREAIARLVAGPPAVPGMPILIVGSVGLAINLGSAFYLWRASKGGDMNVRGALLHMLADALGSLGAIVAAILTLTLHIASADAIVSLLIGVLVLFSAWGLLRDSTKVLLQFAPAGFDRDALGQRLSAIVGVRAVHAVRAWSLGSGHVVVTAHLTTHPDAVAGPILREAERLLRHDFGAAYITVQLDPEDAPCAEA